jgi:hypothetical protein
MPHSTPMSELRATLGRRRHTSVQRGSRVSTRRLSSIGGVAKPCSMRASTSPSPYAPTITVRYSMPSLRIGTPKVKRSAP